MIATVLAVLALTGMAIVALVILAGTPRALRGPDPLDRREERAAAQGVPPWGVRRG